MCTLKLAVFCPVKSAHFTKSATDHVNPTRQRYIMPQSDKNMNAEELSFREQKHICEGV